MKSQTGYLDSYENFNKAFDANEENRKRVYDVLKSQTGYLDSYEDFSKGMGYSSSNQAGSVSQQVISEYEQANQSSMNTNTVLQDNTAGSQRQPVQSPEEDKRTIFANYVREQLGNIDRELAKPREALPMPAGSAFIPSTAVAAAQRYGNAQTREQQDRYTSLQAARNFLDEANKVVTEAGKKGKTNFVAGALRGIRDKGFDPDTWMMGISETSYYNLLRRAAEKEERGETLSAEEQQLLDAAAVNMAANAYYASDLGRGYKAGAVTAESIPFMLQFAVNPLSGAGTGIAKTILKHGIKRFGLNTAKRTLAGRAVRGAARVAGDAVAAAGVTATTGLGNVAEDAERRMAGDVQFSQDNNGNIQYAGRVNNVEDTGEAIARAFASTFFENQSEMVGNYFAPIMRGVSGLVKRIPGVKQLSASKVGDLYRGIKDNPTYKEFTDRTQWHGAIGEYAEEVYNNLASVAMGDMTPEELVDLDNNIDTFLGVGLMSAVFGGIGAAGFARDRYTLNRDIRRFEANLTPEEMERWQAVKQVATSGDVEGVREFVKYTMRDDSLTPQEKKDKIAYIYNVMKQSAMEGVAAEQTEEAVEAETQDILAHSDQAANTYTECNRIVVNDVGEMVEQPGHIVGYMGGQPLWIPDGAEPGTAAIPLKEGEYDPASIRSMPTQEVIDETAQAIREDAAEQARRESTYSPDIVPPSIGTTFADGASQYQIVQQNPEGGWLATRTTVDDKGKTVQEVVPVTEQEYYDLMQAQIDSQEQQMASQQATDGVSTGNGRRLDETAPQPAPVNAAQSEAQSGSEAASSSLQGANIAPVQTEQQPSSEIPTDEKGNLLYHRAPVERTVSSINSEGLEPEEVDAFIQANKDAAAKQLKSIEGKAPKMGTNIAKYKTDKAAWQARVADAQAQVDYWNQVGETIAAQRAQVGDTTAEDIRAMGEPMNGHELAAMMLATGRLPLLQSDFKRETGYKGDEVRSLFGLFASEANGGMTIERAGEQLMLADLEGGTHFFDQDDPNAGRNAILDVLSEVRTRGDLTNYIRRNREAMAERERQAEYDAYADWCEREMHMTPEEYEAYQEYIAENNPYEGVAVEKLDRIFAEAEEEIQNNLINTSEYGQEGTSENGSETDSGPSERDEPAGEAGGREASVPVLPGAQPVLPGQVQGRTEGAASQPGPADDGVRAEEGTVSEGTSGGEGIENQINDENNEINVVSSQSNQNDTENEQGEVAGISGESSSLDGENEAATILRTTGHSSTTQDGQGSQSKESLLGELAERASGSNQWIDDITSITSSPIGKGGENETYLSRDGRFAIKVNDFSYLPDNSTNFDSFMNRVDAHNELFPNDAITVLGFTRNSEGRISVVLSQPYISNAREATQEEIDNFLEGMDFYTDMSGNWTDGTFDIADTKPNNVLVDADGNLHFIDVLPYDSRKPGKMLVIPPTRNAFVAPEREEGENLLDYAERVVKTKEIDDARKEVSANPTDAQKEAGNYRKGHITLDGYDITIENPKGSTRSGVDANGQSWSVTMNNDYGYIRGTEGVDGDHIDVFLSDDPTTGDVFVIDQVNEDGTFDEHKVMYGFKSALAAKRAYLANYSPGWKGLGNITKVSKEEFKKWVDSSHRKTKPFAEYKSVKAKGAQNEGKQSAYRSLDDFKAERESIIQETVSDLKDEYAASNLPKTDEELRKEAEELVDYNEESDLYMEVWGRLESFVGTEGMDELEVDARKNGEDRLSLATMIDEIERNEKRGQEESEKIKEQSGPVTKIEDVGEKIGGAKKDRFKEFVEKEKQLQEKPDSFMEELRKLPVSKIFNFNLEALRKDGLSNEAATLIDVIRRIVPSKPRTDWKLKRWVSDVFGLYRFCLTLATAEQGTFGQVLERVTHIKKIGGMYRAAMALGGFDSGLDIGQATLEELGDTAGHYDKEGNWVSIKGQWYVTNAGRYGGIYPDYESAKEALSKFAGENSKPKEKGTEIKFSVYSYKNSGESFITPKGKPNIVVESGFKSSKEALDYLNEHMDELQDKYRNMKDSTSIGFAPNGERKGKDWRGGKDVSAEDFRNTFGFRGVEFGNWANQQERQHALNQAYDAFMDLSEATGISPRGLSLGGELGMAFGARGGGGAAAHYEPGKVVINLTKTQGAGTLAHEWWHSIDNYFSRRRGQALGYNTERKGYKLPIRGGKVERESEEERKEITDAFSDLMKSINASSYGQRSNAYAGLKSSYWKEPTELGARAFAVWVERKLSEKGIVNNFLANNNTIGWESLELTQKYYPYPLESDFESLDVAFDNLFGTIEEKVDEETGNTVLYRDGAGFLSNDDLSDINAPITKILGKSTRTFQQRKAFAERERQRMTQRVQELAEKLHLDNVEIVTEPMTITDRQGKTHHPKGFYNPRAGKIVIVVPNNVNTFDVEQTLLHEAVAHYGLRQLFGEHFDTFLDNVYNNADLEVRRKIVELAKENGWNTRLATEEYLASLAEDTNFEDLNASWWNKIKELFLQMLHKIGFNDFNGGTLSDNELRYILWRSYENLTEPGRYRGILGEAADVVKQNELKVGNYAPVNGNVNQVADARESVKAERIRKLRDSKSVEITGNEIEASDDLKQYKKNALEYGKKLQGEYTNRDTGITIHLQRGRRNGGINEVLQHDYKDIEHLQSIAAIPQIIENSIYIDSRENIDTDKNPDVKEYQYYVCGLKIGNVDYTVRSTVAVDKNGNRYYDHKLTHIEKGKLLDLINDQAAYDNGFGTTPGTKPTTEIFSNYKDKILLSILQTNDEENLLFRETPDGKTSDDGSRDAYNRSVTGNRFKAQEAYQDSMLALKRLQEVVEKYSGSKLKSYENAYMAENQMSSKSTRETEVYGEKFFKPMLQEVATLMKKGASYQEIIDYMIAKHGLERNEVFAKRDAAQEADRRFEKLYKELEQLYKLGGITQAAYDQRKDKIDSEKEEYYQKRLAKHLEDDYSGLTALAEKYDEADKGFKAYAKDMVDEFESRFNTRSLWEKVNAATKETLRKSYESGMMSRDTYDKVGKMFKHYIPLRGWDEQTAEDVYEYLNSETSPVNSVLKSAKGRRSMSDDPLATIGNMAESAILQGNRNLMKQNFLNMAINHPTDVLTVREAWYVKDPNTGEWILSFPNIEENDDADAIARKVEEHEERMNMLKENGEATKVKEGLNIDYRISARQAKEHIVNVKRNGKDYLIFVNGNPRAAQAVNGMTNPSVETNKLLEGISRFNRQLAANFTNRNPAFVLSNLSRDLIFAVSAVNIKEGGTYARRFATNIPRAMRVISRNLRGKGDANHADDALFEEFLNNGGETGYTSLHSVDEYKRMVSRELNKITGKRDYFRAVRASAQFFSMMNRWAEDVSRFTTYMTSREQGKTISESVNDAKEVTVNFNKKGAGAKTSGVFGWTSGLFRNLYLFFNAAVQSLANFSRLSKKNPRAFYTTLGGFTAAGFLVPVLNGIAISMLGGDDDDYYGNLPEWVRRNNLCLYAGNGKFITIPLPIELRAFYGLGEMAYQTTISEDTNGGDKIAYQAINQITELLPINPLGNNGDLVTTLMPDVISPFWQIYENKDFTGKPIYRQNAFNETMPEWTKAYNSTSDWLVKLSEWTNELAGGDKYKQADVLEPIMNWNPAKVEHLFESYFGGMAKTFNQTAKTLAGGVESVLQGEKSDDLQWYSTPVLNRFVNDASDDRSAFSNVNERYYRLYDLYEEVGKELRGYGREAARGDLDYLDKQNRLYQSDDYKKYLIFKRNKRIIDRIRDMEKRLPEEATKEKEELQKKVAEMKRSLLEQIDNLE